MSKLDDARKIINEVDSEMARLFEKRMYAAKLVASYKKEHGLPILDEKREEEVIRRNSEKIENPEIREYYVNFLRDTMSVSRSYQHRLMNGMRVAYSGTEGAYAHIATLKLFPDAEKVAFKNFGSAYAAVENGDCDVAVLPVENSYNGEVGQVTDLMFSGSLYVNGTFDLAVSHALLGVKGSAKADIKTVISHQQALGQCTEYIQKNDFSTLEYTNTALAAKLVSEKNDPTLGAIASTEAADIFGLEIIERNINESRTNTTRFAVLSRSENKTYSDGMEVSSILLFTVKNEAGSLAKAIDVIGSYNFNMKALRSRPMKELLWQYYFYVELEGNVHTENGRKMLMELETFCDRLKVVGSFAKR